MKVSFYEEKNPIHSVSIKTLTDKKITLLYNLVVRFLYTKITPVGTIGKKVRKLI